MCGKFTIVTENGAEKDVYPGGKSELYLQKAQTLIKSEMIWGFTRQNGCGLIFNARAETVTRKAIFSKLFYECRVAVPAVAFSEWSERRENGRKQEYRFESASGERLYLAGIARRDDPQRFAVLTTEASFSKGIHPRFPIVLSESEFKPYLRDTEYAELLLSSIPKELNKVALPLKRF